jgi:hypothetical protein
MNRINRYIVKTGGQFFLDFAPGTHIPLENPTLALEVLGRVVRAAEGDGHPEQRLNMSWKPWEETEDEALWTTVKPGGLVIVPLECSDVEEHIFEQLQDSQDINALTRRAMAKVLTLDFLGEGKCAP